MVRSDVENMLEWKQRRGQSSVTFTLIYDLDRLRELWRARAKDAPEFADFIPMRLVTIIEVFIRESIRELVDTGSPYIERTETLAKGIRLDFTLLASLQGRKLSIGDLIAHAVSINEPGRVVAYLTTLIPDFVKRLKSSHPRWLEEESSWPLKPIIADYDHMMANLTRLFIVRHIVTHELPSEPVWNLEEIDGFLQAVGEFIEATDWVLVEVLRGGVPRTQTEMNIQAGGSLEETEAEMRQLLSDIKDRGEIDFDMLEETQAAWDAYAAKEADLHASRVEGGSMYSMVWASAKMKEHERRIETLKWWAAKKEGDL